jgi:hypothetical protein
MKFYYEEAKQVLLILLAARSKAMVCVRLRAGIAGSNPTKDIAIFFLWVLFVVR